MVLQAIKAVADLEMLQVIEYFSYGYSNFMDQIYKQPVTEPYLYQSMF